MWIKKRDKVKKIVWAKKFKVYKDIKNDEKLDFKQQWKLNS